MFDKHWFWFTIIGLLAILARIFITMEKLVWYGILRTISTGAFVGVVVGLGLLADSDLAQWQKYAILGIAVAIAEDLFIALISFGKTVKNDPRAFIDAIIRRRS
jgi:hypothetical protein